MTKTERKIDFSGKGILVPYNESKYKGKNPEAYFERVVGPGRYTPEEIAAAKKRQKQKK